ncbi:hypothetical protein LMG26685_03882 [Achromobacter mucicolens]|nr:hypothetical protein LMG26685_03882 [Achromobacter mucicolens]
MGDSDGPHDRQSQSGSGQRFPGAAARETLLHGFLLVVGHAGAAVRDGERDAIAGNGRGLDLNRPVRRVAQGIVGQVAQHFAQRDAIAGDARAAHFGRNGDAQPLRLQRTNAAARFVDGFSHADQRAGALAEPVGDGGVHEQLVDELAGVGGVQMDAFEPGVQALRIGLVQRYLGLRPQRGKGRADLVRGIGDQGVKRVHGARQPLHEAVERFDQPPHFARDGFDKRLQVIRRAPPQFAFDDGKRREGALHAKPQQAQRDQGHDDERQHAAPKNLARQRLARAQRLGDTQGDPAGVLAGRYQAANGRDPDGFVVIAQIGENGRGRLREGQAGRKVAVPGDEPAV